MVLTGGGTRLLVSGCPGREATGRDDSDQAKTYIISDEMLSKKMKEVYWDYEAAFRRSSLWDYGFGKKLVMNYASPVVFGQHSR